MRARNDFEEVHETTWRKRASILFAAIALTACASISGVVSVGQDEYFVSRQAATGFSGIGNLKAEVLREASAQCVGQRKTMRVLETNESKPPYLLGNYPKVDIQFSCVDPG